MWGRKEYILVDSLNHETVFFGPNFILGFDGFSVGEKYLIAPGSLLGFTNTEVYFKLFEFSEYTKYWNEYPALNPLNQSP